MNPYVLITLFTFISFCNTNNIEHKDAKQNPSSEHGIISLDLSQEQLDFINDHKQIETFDFHQGEKLRRKINAEKIANGRVLWKQCENDNCETKITIVFQDGQIIETNDVERNEALKYEYNNDGRLIKHGAFDLEYVDGNLVSWSNGINKLSRKISYEDNDCKKVVLGLDKPRVLSKSCYNNDSQLRSVITKLYSEDSGKVISLLTQLIDYKGNDMISTTFTDTDKNGKVTIDALNKFKYENGLLLKKYTSYDAIERIDSISMKYEVSSTDRVSLVKYTSKRGKRFSKYTTYNYDSNKRLIEVIRHFQGNRQFKLEYIEK